MFYFALMKKVIRILFNLYIIVLCCPLCVFKNMHEDHKILGITDENELKKEYITIENAKNEFDENIKKLEELKNKIENEMKEIDNTYIKVDKEITESYEIKREKLNKEESDLKEKLKTEVTKIKEKFELTLTEIYNIYLYRIMLHRMLF